MNELLNGSYKILLISINGDPYYPIGCTTSNSFTENVEMLGTTVRTNNGGWASSVPVGQSYSFSFSGVVTKLHTIADTVTYNDLKIIKRSRQIIQWKTTDGRGFEETGVGFITSLSDAAGIDEFISFSAGIQGVGVPTISAETSNDLVVDLNTQL